MIRVRHAPVLGYNEGFAFVHGRDQCGVAPVRTPIHAESPNGWRARKERLAYGLSMGVVARGFGLSAADVSDVELGKKIPESWDQWFVALAQLAERDGK